MTLLLRPVQLDDEEAFRAAHEELWASDQFSMGLGFDKDEPFEAYIDRHDKLARNIDVPDGMVPATFLVAVAHDTIVGRASIRHELNDFLAAEGGHIGYGILAHHRRKGYATKILRQSLIIARSLGVRDALLVCEDDNIGSATVIERCGGKLIDQTTDSAGIAIRRYLITP